jgi:hypothetical protein
VITPFGELPNRLALDMSLAEQHHWLMARVGRRAVLSAGAGLGLAAIVGAAASASASAGPSVVGRQVVFGADPTSQMTVAFAVATAFRSATVSATGEGHEVHAHASVQLAPGSTTRYARSSLIGLRSGVTYDYVVQIDGANAATGKFTTARTGVHPFRFSAFGDQGTGSDPVRVLKQVAVLDPALHLFAGDLCYADQSGLGGPGDVFKPKFWDVWIKQNDPVASRIPWMCVPGNHEMEPGFDVHGYAGVLARVPIGGTSPIAVPVASTFRVGSVGFIGLDSNDVSYEIPANRGWTGGAQTDWLKSTLAAMRAAGSGIDFVVVFLHASPYSTNETHASEGGIRDAWVPLFDQHQVDLVISGHNHCYERTLPIRDGQPSTDSSTEVDSAKGTTYVTAGGGGASTADYGFIAEANTRVTDEAGHHNVPVPWRIPAERVSGYSVVCVDVTPAASSGGQTTLHVRALDADGAQFDEVVLHRTSTAVAPAAADSSALPWLVGGSVVGAVAVATGGALAVRARRG